MESSKQDYHGIVIASIPGQGILFARRSHSRDESAMILGREIIEMLKQSVSPVELTQSIDSFGDAVITARRTDAADSEKIEYRCIRIKESEENVK